MGLSQDEQRKLAEIERRLTAEDPGLAACLASFRRPGPARMLRSTRLRVIGSVVTVTVVGVISLLVYAFLPVRARSARIPGGTVTTTLFRQPATVGDRAVGGTVHVGRSSTAASSRRPQPAIRVGGTTSPRLTPAPDGGSGAASVHGP